MTPATPQGSEAASQPNITSHSGLNGQRPPRKLILRNHQSPGDIVMLTAAVRDLHRTFPGQFLTDVRTSCSAFWENNPHLTPLNDDDPAVELLHCDYPLIHR